MSSYWPTGDQQPGATPAQVEFARNWRDTPKVVFSSTVNKVDWNTRVVTGDAVEEITRLKAGDGEPMRVGGASLAGAAIRAGLVDEYEIVTHPVLVGGGTPFFTPVDSWVNLNLVETRTFPRRGGADQVRDETVSAGLLCRLSTRTNQRDWTVSHLDVRSERDMILLCKTTGDRKRECRLPVADRGPANPTCAAGGGLHARTNRMDAVWGTGPRSWPGGPGLRAPRGCALWYSCTSTVWKWSPLVGFSTF